MVQVVAARVEQQAALENLFQLYVHDFSEHWAGQPRGELGDDGRFKTDSLDAYWSDDTYRPLLLRLNSSLIGFALVNGESHSGSDLDYNMGEFFIARKHRRGGVGTSAAYAIFTLFPGRWEAAVARRNTVALAFWRRVISGPTIQDQEEIDINNEAWNGPILRFHITGGARR